jgi:hypothetical protein
VVCSGLVGCFRLPWAATSGAKGIPALHWTFFLGAYTAAFVLVFILHDDQRPDCLCIKWAKRPRCPSLPMSLLVGVTVFNIADMVVVASCVADLRMPDYLIMAVISPLSRVTLALSSTSTLLAPRASCKLRTPLPSRPDI